MRSSSVKSAIATLTIVVSLITAVPSVHAREANTRETAIAERGEGPTDRAFGAIQRVLRRLIRGGVTTNGDGTSVPIPNKRN